MTVFYKISIHSLLLIVCTLAAYPTHCTTGLELANEVLDKLYKISGQYIYEKPALEISSENERVAAYSPSKNLITIDKKALDICQTMGTESSNALAFLIGHELAHAFQKEVRQQGETTHFLSYDKHIHSMVRTEKVADIQGVFVGYLAGYGMQKAIPIILEKLYTEYGLMGKKLPNYPTYEERTRSAKEVVALVEDLKDLFDVNHYLLALEEYSLASVTLEHILEYYQGYEIQNNLGVTYLYSAFEFFDTETDKYQYPIKLDTSSLLAKVDISRGSQLSFMERKFRDNILNAALNYFEKASELNPNYFIAKINKACALNLLRQSDKAHAFLKSNHFTEKETRKAEYQLILGITAALTGNDFNATNIFDKILKSDKLLSVATAQFNLNILKGGEIALKQKNEIELLPSFYPRIDRLKLTNTRGWHEIKLDVDNDIVCKTNKTVDNKSFSFMSGFKSKCSIVISDKITPSVSIFEGTQDLSSILGQNVIFGKNCFYMNLKKENLIIKCDKNGKILEMGKYFLNQ